MILIAKAMNGNSIHILHREIKIAFGSHSAVEEASNVGMLKSGKNLPLLTESIAKKVGGQRQIDQLDGDLLFEVAINAMRQINGAHAATAQQAIQLIRTDPLAVREAASNK